MFLCSVTLQRQKKALTPSIILSTYTRSLKTCKNICFPRTSVIAWEREHLSIYPVCLNSTPDTSSSKTSNSKDLFFQHQSSCTMLTRIYTTQSILVMSNWVNTGRFCDIKRLCLSSLSDNNLQIWIHDNACSNRPGSQHCNTTRNPTHLSRRLCYEKE